MYKSYTERLIESAKIIKEEEPSTSKEYLDALDFVIPFVKENFLHTDMVIFHAVKALEKFVRHAREELPTKDITNQIETIKECLETADIL